MRCGRPEIIFIQVRTDTSSDGFKRSFQFLSRNLAGDFLLDYFPGQRPFRVYLIDDKTIRFRFDATYFTGLQGENMLAYPGSQTCSPPVSHIGHGRRRIEARGRVGLFLELVKILTPGRALTELGSDPEGLLLPCLTVRDLETISGYQHPAELHLLELRHMPQIV